MNSEDEMHACRLGFLLLVAARSTCHINLQGYEIAFCMKCIMLVLAQSECGSFRDLKEKLRIFIALVHNVLTFLAGALCIAYIAGHACHKFNMDFILKYEAALDNLACATTPDRNECKPFKRGRLMSFKAAYLMSFKSGSFKGSKPSL
jgi:hypothetical protein